MKLKKLIASVSAVAMLGSMLVAVPASAAVNERVYPTEGIWTRVNENGVNGSNYAALDVTNTEEAATTEREMQWKKNDGTITGFAAVYKYDLSEYINDAGFAVELTANDNAYSVMFYSELPENNADDGKELYTFVNNNISSAYTLTNKKITIGWDNLKEKIDDKNCVYLILTRASSTVWKKKIDMNEAPYLIVTDNVAKIGEVYYNSLDDAITAANSATGDCTIELLKDAKQSVKLSPDVNVTINGNGNTITGSGTLYQAKASDKKTITIQDAVLNITNTSTEVPALTTQWKDASKITLNNTSITADVIFYSTNNSNLTVTGDSDLNGTVYLYVGRYNTDANRFRTGMTLNGYTGSSEIDVRLTYGGETTGNHSDYAIGEWIINQAWGNDDKINFIDDTYGLGFKDNGDIVLAEPSITINNGYSKTLYKGESCSLNAVTSPVNLADNVVWTFVGEDGSDVSDSFTLEDGVLTYTNGGRVGGSTGKVNITATAGEITATTTVYVQRLRHVSYNIADESGEAPEMNVVATVNDSEAYEQNVVYGSEQNGGANSYSGHSNYSITFTVPDGYTLTLEEKDNCAITVEGNVITATSIDDLNNDFYITGILTKNAPALPETVTANADDAVDFDNAGSNAASLWNATINGTGATYSNIIAKVTLKDSREQTASPETMPTITGDCNVTVYVVVNKAISDIESVVLTVE